MLNFNPSVIFLRHFQRFKDEGNNLLTSKDKSTLSNNNLQEFKAIRVKRLELLFCFLLSILEPSQFKDCFKMITRKIGT
jgi:hypothetical protein